MKFLKIIILNNIVNVDGQLECWESLPLAKMAKGEVLTPSVQKDEWVEPKCTKSQKDGLGPSMPIWRI